MVWGGTPGCCTLGEQYNDSRKVRCVAAQPTRKTSIVDVPRKRQTAMLIYESIHATCNNLHSSICFVYLWKDL